MTNNIKSSRKILISRTDAIGDLALTLPALGWLRSTQSDIEIHLLVSAYAAEIARASQFVDQVHIWPKEANDRLNCLQSINVDQIIHMYPNFKIAQLARKAKILKRSGVCGRFYHWRTCNDLLWMKRSGTGLHESYLNLKLLAKSIRLPCPGFETFKAHIVEWSGLSHLRKLTSSDSRVVILHPYSRGSGREWPTHHFVALAHRLVDAGYTPWLCGTAEDAKQIESIIDQFPIGTRHLMGVMNLNQYIETIGRVGGLVASGTGPLHIASLIGVPVVGLFPPKPEIDAARWGVLNSEGTSLQLNKSCAKVCMNQACECMSDLSVNDVFEALINNMIITK